MSVRMTSRHVRAVAFWKSRPLVYVGVAYRTKVHLQHLPLHHVEERAGATVQRQAVLRLAHVELTRESTVGAYELP